MSLAPDFLIPGLFNDSLEARVGYLILINLDEWPPLLTVPSSSSTSSTVVTSFLLDFGGVFGGVIL